MAEQEIILFLQGLIIGLLAAAPVGAVAVMCIQRTMNSGMISGFILGLGSATGDIIYAAIAGFGITFIKDFLLENRFWLGLVGSIVLIIMGIRISMTDPIKQIRNKKKSISKWQMVNDYITAVFLTISNPVTILGFGALFAAFGVINDDSSKFEIGSLLVGVFIGALGWWFFLSAIVNIFRNKIRLRNLLWINRITGIVVLVFGIGLLIWLIFFSK